MRKNIFSNKTYSSNTRKQAQSEGIIPPKYILKAVDKSGQAETWVYFCKAQLISDMIEHWGSCDLILQQFIIQKTL